MGDPLVCLRAELSIAEGLRRLRQAHLPGGPVVDASGVFLGVVTVRSLEETPDAEAKMALRRVTDVTAPTVQASAALDAAFDALGTTPETWVSVTDSGDHVVGIFTASALISGYRRALAANTVRLSKLTGNAVSVELCVREGAEQPDRPFVTPPSPPGRSSLPSSATEPSCSPMLTRRSSPVIW